MPIKIFFCYAHEDEELLDKLKIHLKPLQRQGLIDDMWHDRMISAGIDWEREIDKRLNMAHIILLLISPDFMASAYPYSAEMNNALERQRHGKVRIIPIILRPTHWKIIEELYNVQALPTDGIPLTSASWHSLDEALFDVVEGIRKVISELSIDTAQVSNVINNSLQINDNVSNTSILIVDDSAELTHLVRLLLFSRGYTVFTVRDGIDAIRYINSNRPDIILLDINMGRMGGLEVIDQLQAKGFTIPIILMTSAPIDIIEIALNNGANGVIRKPFVPSTLFKTINSILEKNRFMISMSDDDLIG